MTTGVKPLTIIGSLDDMITFSAPVITEVPSCVPMVASVTLRDAEREHSSEVRRSEDKTKYNAFFCIYLVQKIELVHVFARYLAI